MTQWLYRDGRQVSIIDVLTLLKKKILVSLCLAV